MSGTYRIIQVGLGNWGADWATKVLPKLDDVEVAGWVDTSARTRATFADRVGVPETDLYPTLTEALAAHPDVKIVLAPVAWTAHHAVATEALTAGCHLLLEKPMTLDLAQARELTELAAGQELIFAIDQNYRWGAAVPVVREVVRSGRLGRLRTASVCWHRDHGGVRSHALVELAIHHLDLIRHIFGADGSAVSCLPHTPITDRLEPTTGADALIRLDTGLVINYHLSAEGTAPTTEWPGQWRISGDDAELVWGDAAVGRDPEPNLVMISTVDGSTTRLPVPLPPGLRDRAGVLREFLDAVDGRATPTSPAADNVRSIALLDALLTAAASGRTEPVLPT